jgi:hypothetical protein
LLGEPAKHEDRSRLADLEYLRRRGGAICWNEDAPILNVEEDAERGSKVNHPDHRNEILVFGQGLSFIRSRTITARNTFARSLRGAPRGAFCEKPVAIGPS